MPFGASGWAARTAFDHRNHNPDHTLDVRGLCRGYGDSRKLLTYADRAGFEPAIRF